MISREEAQKYLEQHRIKNLNKKRIHQLSELSEESKHLGLLILNQTKVAGSDSWEKTEKREQELKQFIKGVSDDLWDEKYFPVLEALFGELAGYVKQAWKMQTGLMYQASMYRRSFRSPNNPLLTLDKKIDWLMGLPDMLVYDFKITEYARYVAYIDRYYRQYSYLLAAAINSGTDDGNAVLQILLDTVYGRDDIASVSRDGIKALLLSNNTAGYEAVEKLLISAQRQEGLRQTVLECLDETHPNALKRMMKLIINHKLARFSSVVRAIDVWFGFGWDSEREKAIYKVLENGLQFLENPETIPAALDNPDNLIVFTALWASGVQDIEQTFPLVEKVLENQNVDKKVMGLYFLQQTDIQKERQRLAWPWLEYDNLKVASLVLQNLARISEEDYPDVFTKLELLLKRVPQKGMTYESQAFSWLNLSINRDDVFRLMLNVSKHNHPERIIPYLEEMGLSKRENAAQILFDRKQYSPAIRNAVFTLLGDRGEYVRRQAFKAVKKLKKLEEEEILRVEALLGQKAADLRKGCITALLQQNDTKIKHSAERLLFAKKAPQRLAGLDILLQMKKRGMPAVGKLAQEYADKAKISVKEQILLDDILSDEQEERSLDDALGLNNPNELCHSPKPEKQIDLSLDLEKARKELHKLDELFEENKDYEYTVESGYRDSTRLELIGNHFPAIYNVNKGDKAAFTKLPLSEVWKKWWEESELDIFDVTKLSVSFWRYGYSQHDIDDTSSHWIKEVLKKHYVSDDIKKKLKYPRQITTLFDWITTIWFSEKVVDFLLDATETLFASIPEAKTWRANYYLIRWEKTAIKAYDDEQARAYWTDKQKIRLWHLLNWKYLSAKKKTGDYQPPLRLYLDAVTLGEASESDIFDKIMHSNIMRELTRHKRSELLEQYDFQEPIVIQCRDRVLEIELKRGDSNTLATPLAVQIQSVPGIGYLIKILNALGEESLQRAYIHEDTKRSVLSHLLKVSHPEKADSQETFNQAIKAAGIAEQRLLEVAVSAPAWVVFVENYLHWQGLETAVWWFHAHTKEYAYQVEQKWENAINRYTPLSVQNLVDGAVDVDWFKQAYKTLGKKRWNSVYAAAKYTADSGGHRRAQLFADSMRGINTITYTMQRIKEKRNQDYVRAMGLIPLSKRNAEKEVLKRYQLANRFLKESKQFGSQRQTSEALAVRIALENLARTAGFSDTLRLTWAMESKETSEILAKAKPLTFDQITISLAIDDQGKAHLVVEKAEQKLKSIPAKYRKNQAVKQLQEHKQTLVNQYSRAKRALEEAMNRGDEFSMKEIQGISQHPVVSHLLKNLVLVVSSEKGLKMGFPDTTGQHLISARHKNDPLVEEDKIRIAHCVDLESGGAWSDYQHDCFVNKRVQPFKQIFRELYLLTADEKAEKSVSRRYAGHQVQPKKTVALLKSRAWRVDYETGLQKVFHQENLVATIYAMADWFTPADVEAPTLETVQFLDRKTWKKVAFEKIEARIFSEVMRDIDLVVSVAHAGGVDPEASHSTVEMRSVLIDETAKLLGVNTVQLQKNHAMITGEICHYSVHLGSGVVHRQPGGYISILPVHSSHRGRLFLPFADDDPKTAEIMSKILLLVNDKEIKDPTILQQLHG
ncbi:MAG TPA: DUF4132 domain-containing protein [Beggiatoa sp.]|nr:DUF4132 domain-containing protein [Beggiatoa sp.]